MVALIPVTSGAANEDDEGMAVEFANLPRDWKVNGQRVSVIQENLKKCGHIGTERGSEWPHGGCLARSRGRPNQSRGRRARHRWCEMCVQAHRNIRWHQTDEEDIRHKMCKWMCSVPCWHKRNITQKQTRQLERGSERTHRKDVASRSAATSL